jgi:hypothetical protein
VQTADKIRDGVREFLCDGLRNLRQDMKSPEKANHPWHHGYLEGSRRLAKDLCKRLDIAWDDATDAPAPKASTPTKDAAP